MASRMRIAAAMARSGVSKVAITASPMVFTTAPLSDAMISWSSLKCSLTRSKAVRSPTRSEGPPPGIAHGLHDRPSFGRDDLLEQLEMLVDEVESREIADAIIELGG